MNSFEKMDMETFLQQFQNQVEESSSSKESKYKRTTMVKSWNKFLIILNFYKVMGPLCRFNNVI